MSYFLGRRKNFNSTHHQFSFISTMFTTPFERLASYCDALQAPKKKFKVLRTPFVPKRGREVGWGRFGKVNDYDEHDEDDNRSDYDAQN